MALPEAMTGQGATVSLTGGGGGCLKSIQLPTMSIEAIDASCLSDTGFAKKVANDLTDAGSVQMTFFIPPGGNMSAPDASQQTLTVTMPAGPNGQAGATITGDGFISEVSGPSIGVGEIVEQTITFTFDGTTGPTLAAAAGGS